MSDEINRPTIFRKSGGFRRLYSLNFATIVHLGVMGFCKRFISWKDDPLGKTVGQMVGASRSCKQNIIEGSASSQTSSETEIKLTNVAKASMQELAGDLEDYIGFRDEVPWSVHSNEHQAIASILLDPFVHSDDEVHDHWVYLHSQKRKFAPWLESNDDIVCAKALLVLAQRTIGLLNRQLKSQEGTFVEEGGIRERMTTARKEMLAQRDDAPTCPACGKQMRKRKASKGDFWGCSGYPACRGTREMEKA
jgi:restriction system protein